MHKPLVHTLLIAFVVLLAGLSVSTLAGAAYSLTHFTASILLFILYKIYEKEYDNVRGT